jgi:Leucine-rich repeat (LRR) protein
MFGRHKNNNVEKPMFKMILVVMVFTLAACGENSNKSMANKQISQNKGNITDSSDFNFILDDELRTCLDKTGMTVESVHTLVCSGKGIKSLVGIEQLSSLKNVNVSHNQLTDLSPLSEIKGLQVFYATNNQIESVDALDSLDELNAISLRSNRLTNVDALYTLPQLQKLYVQGNIELALDVNKFPKSIIVAI